MRDSGALVLLWGVGKLGQFGVDWGGGLRSRREGLGWGVGACELQVEGWIPNDVRRGWGRGRNFWPVRYIEVLKAARGLAPAKAPGPDATPAEVYRNIAGALLFLAAFFAKMIELRVISRELLEVHVVLLDKPGRDPGLCASKRPISLICALMKVLETVCVDGGAVFAPGAVCVPES